MVSLLCRTLATWLPIGEQRLFRFPRSAAWLAALAIFSLLLVACQSLAPGSAPAKTPSVSSLRTWQPTPPERSFRPCAALVKEQGFQTILNAMENILKPDGPDVPMSEAAWSKNLESLPGHVSSVFDQYTNGTKPLKLVFAEIIASQYGGCLQLTERSFLGFDNRGSSLSDGLYHVRAGESPALDKFGDDLGRIIPFGRRVVAEVSSSDGERVAVVHATRSKDGAEDNGYELLRILPDNTLKVHSLARSWSNGGCALEPGIGCWPPESELYIANSLLEKFRFEADDPTTSLEDALYISGVGPLLPEAATGALVVPILIKGRRPMRVDFRLLDGKLDHTVTPNESPSLK